jgi:hypothetical protein
MSGEHKQHRAALGKVVLLFLACHVIGFCLSARPIEARWSGRYAQAIRHRQARERMKWF